MKRHPHPFCAKAAAGLLAIVLPLGSVCGQDSLEVTFVGDRELEVRDVVKPASTPTRVDLGMAKPTIDYAPVAKSIAPVTQVEPSSRSPCAWTPASTPVCGITPRQIRPLPLFADIHW